MSEIPYCPNVECDFKGDLERRKFCPQCGTLAQEFGSVDVMNLFTQKDHYHQSRVRGNSNKSYESIHPLYGSAKWKKNEGKLKILSLIASLTFVAFGAWIVFDSVQGYFLELNSESYYIGKIFLGLFFSFAGCLSLYTLSRWEQMKKLSEIRGLNGEEDTGGD